MCDENKTSGGSAPVPDFSTVGFAASAEKGGDTNRLAQAHGQLKELKALGLKVCVGANYNPSNKQLCFSIPIYGDFCITLPVPIPIGGDIKVCAETCGSFIPTGVKATVYVNGNSVFTTTIVGFC